MFLAGSFNKPDIFAPAIMPVTAGKNMAKTLKKDCSFSSPFTICGVYLLPKFVKKFDEPGIATGTCVPLIN